MHRYKKSSKKRGILRAGALLGGMLIFMNVNAAPMSGAGGVTKTSVLDQEVKVAAAVVTNVNTKENSLDNFEYEQAIASLDQKIELQDTKILMNGSAAEAFQVCKKFYTAKDHKALKLPKVKVQAGANLYLNADIEGSVIHTFTDKESVDLLYLCEDGNFYYVEYNDLYRGYVKYTDMDISILSISQLQQASQINLGRFAAISQQDVYMWSEPGGLGETVAVVAADVPMAIIGVEGEWLQVSAAEYTGYVSASEVNIERMLNAEVDSEGYIKLARAEKELQEFLEAEEAQEEESYEDESFEYEEEYEDYEEEFEYEESYEELEYEEPEYEEEVEEEEETYEEVEEETEEEEESYEEESEEESEVSYSGESSANGLTIMNMALNYQGVPYVWGGHSPSGFDCSGLIYYCALQNGISIPRCADTQYFDGNGYHVDYEQLMPGDLVFFSSDSSYDIEHVGIYIGGNQFVHASSGAGYVTISDISGYYSRNYYSAMRLN